MPSFSQSEFYTQNYSAYLTSYINSYSFFIILYSMEKSLSLLFFRFIDEKVLKRLSFAL